MRSIRKFTKLNHILANFASTLQSERTVLIFMKRFILMIGRISATIVLRDFARSGASYCIQEFTLEKNLSNAKCAPRSFPKAPTDVLTQSWFIQMTKSFFAISAKRPSK